MLKFFIYVMAVSLSLYALSFEEYKKNEASEFQKHNDEFKKYKDNLDKEFMQYKKVQDEAFNEYKKDILKKWPKADVSSEHVWVEYGGNYSDKKMVDFKNGTINLDVIAKNEKEARAKIEKLFDDTYNKTTNDALKNDVIENKIANRLNKPKPKVDSNKKIIADIITKQQKTKLLSNLKQQKLKKVKYKGEFIYKANVKLPPQSMLKKAKRLSREVKMQSVKTNMPEELIYAIIHSESSFNPMAKSYIPAFGLMQIVPKTAGIDTYKFLFGKKRLLSSSYLYNSKNNIVIGSNYLHILYFRYLKKIKDPQSRMLCTIAAYNTGAGNVSKAFVGSTNISKASKKINQMSSQEVYKTLMKKLPYNETRKYLLKVTKRMDAYKQLIDTKQI